MTEPVPAAIDALITLFGDVEMPDGVQLQIADGEPLLEEPDYLAVAYSSAEDVPAVDVVDADSDAGGSQSLEEFDVANQLSSATGDGDLGPVRTRVFVIFRALRQALAADPRLGGTVARARLAEWHLVQDRTGGEDGAGAVATVNFTIRIEVWRRA